MNNKPRVALELPEFDTGQYEGCEFHMSDGNACLVLHLTALPEFKIRFQRVRWHRYTQLYSCNETWVRDAYFRLIEVDQAELLNSFIQSDRSLNKPYKELHHFRICLDETGCHEVFAEAFF